MMSRRFPCVLFAAVATIAATFTTAWADDDDDHDDDKVELSSGQLAELQKVAAKRGLNFDDLLAGAKTFMPSGMHDEYLTFASGGHSGQIFVIGVPSMRQLRTIAVFTPEPWQGYGYGVGDDVLKGGDVDETHPLRWGDTHHPALSETKGEYDGQFVFIGDKANARVAVVDLRDFETKQIVKNPLTMSDHGGAFATPDTDYIIEGGQYATPLGNTYAPIEDYKKTYRGMCTLWKFDREKGRIDVEKSFAVELPPYHQDLFDAGKLVSDGLIFGNSFNSEAAYGAIEKGEPPLEAAASQRDMDYLHVIDWKKAEKVFQDGKFEKVNGFAVIKLETLINEGILFLVPEAKSPHGVDVTPDGKFIVIAGKLDPHVTVYSTEKIRQAMNEKKFSGKDDYGIPILEFDFCKEAQVEVGLGPLHTQYDDKGYAYTSLFLDSAICRWTLGGGWEKKHGQQPWKAVAKTPMTYNIGHLVTAEGDTVSPDGRYMIGMNKWSIDRYFQTGPLLPQSFQLVDISEGGEKMPVIYDLPIGNGEPHYAQMIKADKLKPFEVYPELGWDPHTQSVDPMAPMPGDERVEREADGKVHVYATVVRSHFTPENVEVEEGDTVVWHLSSMEQAPDATHGFCIGGYNINLSIEPGEYTSFEMKATKSGTFPYYCTEFCSALHLEMMGYLQVKPKAAAAAAPALATEPQTAAAK
ncbi:MAG TPA: Sec-dependent nitrous-oxide reductase [Tepidisphaeraceae bacterium]|nr:Sec-dependent nitrous-oxide reductase [Tepidisphaeraceae bacterium]